MPTVLTRILAIAVLAAVCCAHAAEPIKAVGQKQIVPLAERYVVHSNILNEDRALLVRLPESYKQGKQRYPVLIVLDGTNHILHAPGVVDFLSRNGRTPEMIVVAVPTLQRRIRDLTPPILKDEKGKEANKDNPIGGADKFLSFLADELEPWIDAQYRTEPYRILMGHSLGGLFNVFALINRPDAFQAHIAASPSLWWDERAYVKQAEAHFKEIKAPHFLFMAWSDHEPSIQESSDELVDWLNANPPTGLEWKSAFYPNNSHGTTPHRTLYEGLSILYESWLPDLTPDRLEKVDFPSELAAFQTARSAKYGYAVAPQPDESDALARWYLKKERFDEALDAAKHNIQSFPGDGRGYSLAGQILEKMNRPAEALAYYKQAAKHPGEYGNIWQAELKQRELQAKIGKAP